MSPPSVRTSFIGRERALDGLDRWLEHAPVVTLTGPGGVGKTRLAAEFVRTRGARFPDGALFIDLAPLTAPGRVATEAGIRLGVTAPAAEVPALVAERIGRRRMLLVLDNCEHVVAAAADLARALPGACPRLRILCTSRQPLGLADEVTLPVEPLRPDTEASELFLDRARAAEPGFVLREGDADAIRAVCARLDGLPLAIELAAPWLRVLSPADLLARLTACLDTPAPRRDLPERQRSLRATLDWSHSLLSDPQRVLFRRLSAFAGDFGLAAAEAVCGWAPLAPDRIPALVAGLRDHSMVATHRDAAGAVRYRLLETLREYAAERATDSAESTELMGRHLAYYLDAAERVDRSRRLTGSDAAVPELVPDGENHRRALAWAEKHDPPAALRLAAALEPFWMIRSVAEGRDRLLRALAAAPAPTAVRARAMTATPLVAAGGLPWAEARKLIRAGVALFEANDDAAGAAMAELTLGLTAFFHGALEEAQHAIEDAVRRDIRASPLVATRAEIYGGVVLSYRPRHLEEGIRRLAAGAQKARESGDGWGLGLALTVAGLGHVRAGRASHAQALLAEALTGRLQGGVTATAIGGLGQLAVATEPRRALTLLEAATAVRDRAGVTHLPLPVERQLGDARERAAARLPNGVARRCRDRARAMSSEEAIALALEPGDGGATRLTSRQEEIAVHAAAGRSNREIASLLHLSVRTVETHLNNILTALGMSSRVQLAAWARETGLAGPGDLDPDT